MKNIVSEINNIMAKNSLFLVSICFTVVLIYRKLWYIKVYLTLMCIGFYSLLDVSNLKIEILFTF